jgi:hypothetical protein
MDPATAPVRGGLACKIAHSNDNLAKVHSVPWIVNGSGNPPVSMGWLSLE